MLKFHLRIPALTVKPESVYRKNCCNDYLVLQVAELVEQPVSIREYHRPLYRCPKCGWSGYSPLPWGVKEGFSYGGRLCSVVGWIGYGGNLTAAQTGVFCRTHLGSPHLSRQLGKDASMVSRELRAKLPAVVRLCKIAKGAVCG